MAEFAGFVVFVAIVYGCFRLMKYLEARKERNTGTGGGNRGEQDMH